MRPNRAAVENRVPALLAARVPHTRVRGQKHQDRLVKFRALQSAPQGPILSACSSFGIGEVLHER